MKKRIFTSFTIMTLLCSSVMTANSALANNIDVESDGVNISQTSSFTLDSQSEKVKGTVEPVYDDQLNVEGWVSMPHTLVYFWVENKGLVGTTVESDANGNFKSTLDHHLKAGTLLYILVPQGGELVEATSTIVKHRGEEQIPAPTVSQSVYEGDTVVHGKGSKAGDTISITNDTGTLIGRGTVNSDLSFSVAIVPQPAFTKLHVVESDGTNTSPTTEVVVQKSSGSEIAAPTVNQPVYEGDTVIHGRGSKAGDSIYITNDKGTMIGSGVVNSDLSFAVTILPQPAYTTLHVVESDGIHTSPATEVVVQESSGSEITAPTVNQPVYEGDTLITGKGSKVGNEIIVTNAAGAVIGAGTVGLNLEFTVAILPQAAYEKIFVVETDGTNTSAATEVIVHEAHEKLT